MSPRKKFIVPVNYKAIREAQEAHEREIAEKCGEVSSKPLKRAGQVKHPRAPRKNWY